MKRSLIILLLITLTIKSQAQEKVVGVRLGTNYLEPNHTKYLTDLGFQAGMFSEKSISKNFAFVKEVYLSKTSFDYHNSLNTLSLENTTYSLGIPISIKLQGLHWVQPFIGCAALYNFHSKTKYYVPNVESVDIQDIQIAVLLGLDIPLIDQVSFDIRYMGTPDLSDGGGVGSYTLNGWNFSIMYTIRARKE